MAGFSGLLALSWDGVIAISISTSASKKEKEIPFFQHASPLYLGQYMIPSLGRTNDSCPPLTGFATPIGTFPATPHSSHSTWREHCLCLQNGAQSLAEPCGRSVYRPVRSCRH